MNINKPEEPLEKYFIDSADLNKNNLNNSEVLTNNIHGKTIENYLRYIIENKWVKYHHSNNLKEKKYKE